MTLRSPWQSLIVRLVGLSLLLLLIVQAAGFAVVRATIDRNARAQIAQALDLDENVWRRLLSRTPTSCARAPRCWRPTMAFARP